MLLPDLGMVNNDLCENLCEPRRRQSEYARKHWWAGQDSNLQPDRYERLSLPRPCRITGCFPALPHITFDLRSLTPVRHLCESPKR